MLTDMYGGVAANIRYDIICRGKRSLDMRSKFLVKIGSTTFVCLARHRWPPKASIGRLVALSVIRITTSSYIFAISSASDFVSSLIQTWCLDSDSYVVLPMHEYNRYTSTNIHVADVLYVQYLLHGIWYS